ncbi:MAG: hypothetical protein BGO99_14650 [Nitrosospira sp. 56-18]|nr:MAG: hypothetical protein BGO99_14650 [Nitrosospira sp. 56-18]
MQEHFGIQFGTQLLRLVLPMHWTKKGFEPLSSAIFLIASACLQRRRQGFILNPPCSELTMQMNVEYRGKSLWLIALYWK